MPMPTGSRAMPANDSSSGASAKTTTTQARTSANHLTWRRSTRSPRSEAGDGAASARRIAIRERRSRGEPEAVDDRRERRHGDRVVDRVDVRQRPGPEGDARGGEDRDAPVRGDDPPSPRREPARREEERHVETRASVRSRRRTTGSRPRRSAPRVETVPRGARRRTRRSRFRRGRSRRACRRPTGASPRGCPGSGSRSGRLRSRTRRSRARRWRRRPGPARAAPATPRSTRAAMSTVGTSQTTAAARPRNGARPCIRG